MEVLDVGEKKSFLVMLLLLCGALSFATGMVEIPPDDEADPSAGRSLSPDAGFVEQLQNELSDSAYSLFRAAADSVSFWDTVSAAAPATLFIPTDHAFDRLPRGAAQELIDDPDRLERVLRYHLVPRLFAPSQLPELGGAVTALDIPVSFSGLGDDVFAGYASVDVAGVRFVNYEGVGVTMLPVDAVLLPPDGSVLDSVQSHPDLSILGDAVAAVGLDGLLAQQEGITLFAPSDEAFARLPAGELDELLANPGALLDILQGHLSLGWSLLGDLRQMPEILTLGGGELMLSPSGRSVTIDRLADVIEPNIIATNGTIHVIDRVILPQGE
ncbi:MAG: fasciclin domain-containing protein [Spirochaetales bacterium]